jgi:hypothetical protein
MIRDLVWNKWMYFRQMPYAETARPKLERLSPDRMTLISRALELEKHRSARSATDPNTASATHNWIEQEEFCRLRSVRNAATPPAALASVGGMQIFMKLIRLIGVPEKT